MVGTDNQPHTTIIASEPLTEERDDWQAIPKNHIVTITPELDVKITPAH